MSKRQVVITVFLTWLLGGCAVFDDRTPEERVRERAQKRVDTLMVGDFEASYAHASPGYRSAHSLSQYQKKFGGVIMWKEAAAGDISCADPGDNGLVVKCDLEMMITYRARGMTWDQTTAVPETWILVDGEWYLYIK